MIGKPYRVCVVGVFVDKNGKVLVAERSDSPGSWQLPQGGVENNEDFETALRREMLEELGIRKLEVLKKSLEPISYDFPEQLTAPISKKYRGQAMTWFLARILDPLVPDLNLATDDEFVNFKWVEPQTAIDLITPWKTQAYKLGFRSLGLISLEETSLG
jgi:putative (di)nucleoside polyphosphate hydrolase